MQDYETADASDGKSARQEALREYMRFILKRIIAIISFGPGILGILWILGRILKR